MMLRVFETFSGYGSQRMALRNLGIEHEVVAISEIDKYAIKSYEAIHGKTLNLGDISKINTIDIPDHDLFTYSFPCQDISIAGKQCGLDIGSGTRSGLLWECQKVIAIKKPKYLLLENVKNLVNTRHKDNFDKWLEWLESQGYTNYWDVLNSKDYGIPQHRERVFVVSILGDHTPFCFNNGFDSQVSINDILESNNKDMITTNAYDLSTIEIGDNVKRGNIITYNATKFVKKRKYSVPILALQDVLFNAKRDRNISNNDISKKLGIKVTTVSHWFRRDNSFSIPSSDVWYDLKSLLDITTIEFDESLTTFEVVPGVYEQSNRVYDSIGLSPTLTTTLTPVIYIHSGDVIRYLTLIEYSRLMGVSDIDFNKMKKVVRTNQLRKLFGNSIVVPVLESIFKELFKERTLNDV
ncbi:MAG: DNA (cytosine-5-)-methyltransferase [Erysipelotrichaceae bacterium]